MNHELLVDAPTTEATSQETKPTIAVPVEKVLAAIARDSRRDAQQYLDESVTPFGGE
jgi:hypothetical protein